MQIGMIIKKLRKEKNITQEQLAEYLGISSRAISQWECGKTMPDISQLPIIANIFNVTTDYLLGVNINMQTEKIDTIVNQALKERIVGNCTKASQILREGIKKYPNSHKIMCELMQCIWRVRDLPENKNNYQTLTEEIIIWGEKILNESTDTNIRNHAIQLLCFTYPNVNQTDKAVELADKMPCIYLSREHLLKRIFKGTMQFDLVRDILWTDISDLYNCMLYNSGSLDDGSRPYTVKENIKIYQKYLDIMNIFFEDGNFGFFREMIARANLNLAAFYMRDSNYELTKKHLKIATEHAIVYDSKYNPDDEYTCILFKGKKFGGVIHNTNKNICQIVLDDINSSTFDKIRNSDEFIGIVKKLEKYADVRVSIEK
ncbi:MAG: helix-turn-helix transcriptional regulator [Ruminococcaceae bacterium]|nr:helix-turn-helix transcriptional regulator [Oscillospiraceae bacterium]